MVATKFAAAMGVDHGLARHSDSLKLHGLEMAEDVGSGLELGRSCDFVN